MNQDFLITATLVFLLVFLLSSIVVTAMYMNNLKKEKFVVCIEAGNQWISDACIHK